MEHKRKPNTTALLSVMLVVGLMLYVLSSAPLAVLVLKAYAADLISLNQYKLAHRAMAFVYAPLHWLADAGPEPLRGAYGWYLSLFMDLRPMP